MHAVLYESDENGDVVALSNDILKEEGSAPAKNYPMRNYVMKTFILNNILREHLNITLHTFY